MECGIALASALASYTREMEGTHGTRDEELAAVSLMHVRAQGLSLLRLALPLAEGALEAPEAFTRCRKITDHDPDHGSRRCRGNSRNSGDPALNLLTGLRSLRAHRGERKDKPYIALLHPPP